jgi:hypothetical protein
MMFKAELARLVLAGEKTVTRRLAKDNPRSPWWLERCRYRAGSRLPVACSYSAPPLGWIDVVSVERMRLGRLDADEARREGFTTVEEFEAAWTRINGSYDEDMLVWRVEFSPAPVPVDRGGDADGR